MLLKNYQKYYSYIIPVLNTSSMQFDSRAASILQNLHSCNHCIKQNTIIPHIRRFHWLQTLDLMFVSEALQVYRKTRGKTTAEIWMNFKTTHLLREGNSWSSTNVSYHVLNIKLPIINYNQKLTKCMEWKPSYAPRTFIKIDFHPWATLSRRTELISLSLGRRFQSK